MNRNVNLAGMRAVSLDSIFEERETCNECEIESVINTCNKCGNGVCKQKQCSWKFPHKFHPFCTLHQTPLKQSSNGAIWGQNH